MMVIVLVWQEASMQRFSRLTVSILVLVGAAMVIARPTAADQINSPGTLEKAAPAYETVGQPPPGPAVESVLTDPRGALTNSTRGIGWLLHYGTRRDNCSRVEENPGMRMMCVAW